MTRPDEVEVLNYLANAWNAFAKLPQQHPDDGRDFCDAIHRAQDLIAVRVARRADPAVWQTVASTAAGQETP